MLSTGGKIPACRIQGFDRCDNDGNSFFEEVKKRALAEPHIQPALTTLGGKQLL